MKRQILIFIFIALILSFIIYQLYKYFFTSQEPQISLEPQINQNLSLVIKNKFNIPITRNDLFYSITLDEKYLGMKLKDYLSDIKFNYDLYEPIHHNTLNKRIKDYNELELVPVKNLIQWVQVKNLDSTFLKSTNLPDNSIDKVLEIAKNSNLPLQIKSDKIKEIFKSNTKSWEVLKRFVILSEI